ncbi:hypothetical protein HG536_0A02060 [Torulaspora globosa]|uniref:Transmembrane protein n=1 Tax=Torulaspora globosa TaxID=48254 RepID=A0A7G3ZA53_9SACH|nr:uncharacterized protein HG536_0A02060 [Torulaspora globosa]QLL30389.1 hypothetical protein HG536_0A02060 [Torulaspora globosa]
MASKPKNLNSFVEEEAQWYACECPSCQAGARYESLVPRWLAGGFFLPFLWIGNILIYVYTQWHLDYEPTHAEIPPEELPTVYEVETKIDKTHLEISNDVAAEIDRVNETTVTFADPASPPHGLQYHRKLFLKQAASQILDSHEAKRAYYRKWTMWTVLAVVAYSVTILLLVMAYDTGYTN